MKKGLIIFFIISTFLISIVSAQTNDQIITTDPLENIIVKEHFLTKKELKDEMGKQSQICLLGADQMIINSFKEVEIIISDTINKTLLKLSLIILGIFVFAGSTWYYIRLKLDNRLSRIRAMRERARQSTEKPLKEVKKAL